VNREQFMAALGERNAEREGLRERSALVLRALDVQKRRVSNVYEVFVPSCAWGGSLVVLVMVWDALSARQLAAIMLGHIFFRAFARVFINVVWIPRMVRDLGKRFPEFKTEIEDCYGGKDDDD
jgi:hypothetical protein